MKLFLLASAVILLACVGVAVVRARRDQRLVSLGWIEDQRRRDCLGSFDGVCWQWPVKKDA